jgi:hypothetical protein
MLYDVIEGVGMWYKLGFDGKWSDLGFWGENPHFWVKTAQEDECARPRGLARSPTRASTRVGDCPRKCVFRSAIVWGFLDWHPIRDIKRGWLVKFGRNWKGFTMVKA